MYFPQDFVPVFFLHLYQFDPVGIDPLGDLCKNVFFVCGTDHTGKDFYPIGPAGSCLILPEPPQVSLGKRIAFKFNMIPPAVSHHIVKILIHLSGFQMYQLRRSDSLYRFFNA